MYKRKIQASANTNMSFKNAFENVAKLCSVYATELYSTEYIKGRVYTKSQNRHIFLKI